MASVDELEEGHALPRGDREIAELVWRSTGGDRRFEEHGRRRPHGSGGSYSLPNLFSAAHESLHWSMSVSERSRYFHCAGVWPEPFT